MNHVTNTLAGAACALIGMTGAALAQDCGDITIAEMNWASAELMANVDAIILEEGYGCDVELVPGATTTTFASMSEKGQPDIAGELWINSIQEPLAKAYDEGTMVMALDGPITGLGEGWWVPPYFVEAHPDLKTVLDIVEHPELFPHPEDPDVGAFYGCPAGWACQMNNANLFRAFNMEDKGWRLVDPGSAAGLDGSISKAVERGENWFGYYWAPTSIIGKYGLKLVPWGVDYAGDENWNNCISLEVIDCEDPQQTAWVKSQVHSVVAKGFAEKGGPAYDYIKVRIFPGTVMNEMLAYMTDNQAAGEDAAVEFLLEHEDVWTQWVPADIAEKVKDAL